MALPILSLVVEETGCPLNVGPLLVNLQSIDLGFEIRGRVAQIALKGLGLSTCDLRPLAERGTSDESLTNEVSPAASNRAVLHPLQGRALVSLPQA